MLRVVKMAPLRPSTRVWCWLLLAILATWLALLATASEQTLDSAVKKDIPKAPGSWTHSIVAPPLQPPPRKLRVGITISVPKNPDSMFTNGAKQAAFFLFEMLWERHDPFFINLDVGDPKNFTREEWQLHRLPIFSFREALTRQPDIVIQMGMQMRQEEVDMCRTAGIKVANYRVGSTYIISMENMLFNRSTSWVYVTTNYDAVWTLPSYVRQSSFSHLMYRAPRQNIRGVPYLWTPRFYDFSVSKLSQRHHYSNRGTNKTAVIMEPNINVFKTALIPMAAIEALNRRRPGLLAKAMVTNTDKMAQMPQFKSFVANVMGVYADHRMTFEKRYEASWLWSNFGDIILSHQWKNELNYLHLEALYSGYPLVHNSPFFKDCGYYYEGNDVQGAAAMLEKAILEHDANLDQYLEKARQCVWRHSPKNPGNVYGWDKAMFDLLNTPPDPSLLKPTSAQM